MWPSCQNPLWIKVFKKKEIEAHQYGWWLLSSMSEDLCWDQSAWLNHCQTHPSHRAKQESCTEWIQKKWFHYYTLHKQVVSFASGDVKIQNHIKMRDDRDEMRALRRAWPEIKIIASARGEKEKSLMLKESTFSMVYGLQMMWKERTGFIVFFWVTLKCARRHCLKILSSFEFNDSEN